MASKEHPQRRPPPGAGKKPTLSDEEALFNRKLAEANRYLDDIDRLLLPIARKVDAAKTDEDLDLNSEVDEIEALIFSHNDAMESARAAWLKGDLGRDTFDRLMLARSPASLGLQMFANDAQAKRAGVQWKKIGARLKERIAFLDNVILAMQVMEVAGDLASLAFGGTVLLKAFKAGGKIVLVKTVAKTVAAGAVSYVAGKVVEAGLKAAGVSEETISGVQHAAELVTWLLLLRKIRTSLPNRPKPAVPSTAPITSPTPKAPLIPKAVQPAAPRGPLKNQSGDPEIAAQRARTQPYPEITRPRTRSRNTGTGLVPASTVDLGKWGEARLRLYYRGQGQKPNKAYKTSFGNRYLDLLLNNEAHEAKAGINVKLSASIERQALADAELVATGKVQVAHWHFFQGAEQALLDFLSNLGIRYTVH